MVRELEENVMINFMKRFGRASVSDNDGWKGI